MATSKLYVLLLTIQLQLLLVLTAPTLSKEGEETHYEDCGTNGITIISFVVEGCTELPCQFKVGTNVTSTTVFTADMDFTSLSNRVYGIFEKQDVPFYTPTTTICDNKGVNCPIKKGQQVTNVLTLHVEETYPKLTVKTKTELVDENNTMRGCIQIGVQLV